MSLEVLIYPDKILRQKAIEVEELDKGVKKFIEEMLELVGATHNSIGLAATQVGKLLRIFIIRPYKEDADKKPYYGPPEVYINPKLSDPSDELIDDSEGCLSLPGIYYHVIRPESITVEALDINGKKFKKRLSGYEARQVMHENDHLNGVLFIDRITAKDKKSLPQNLSRMSKLYKSKK